jgi:hypothetical protein
MKMKDGAQSKEEMLWAARQKRERQDNGEYDEMATTKETPSQWPIAKASGSLRSRTARICPVPE